MILKAIPILTVSLISMGFSPQPFRPLKNNYNAPRVDEGKCPDFNGKWEGHCKGSRSSDVSLSIEYLYCIEFIMNGYLYFMDYPNIQHQQIPGKNGYSETHTDLFEWDFKTQELHMDFNTDQFYKNGDRHKTTYQGKMYKEKDILFFEYKGQVDSIVDDKKSVSHYDVICQLEQK